jgi:hypothetical protein
MPRDKSAFPNARRFAKQEAVDRACPRCASRPPSDPIVRSDRRPGADNKVYVLTARTGYFGGVPQQIDSAGYAFFRKSPVELSDVIAELRETRRQSELFKPRDDGFRSMSRPDYQAERHRRGHCLWNVTRGVRKSAATGPTESNPLQEQLQEVPGAQGAPR